MHKQTNKQQRGLAAESIDAAGKRIIIIFLNKPTVNMTAILRVSHKDFSYR